MFGTVNANRVDYENGVASLGRFMECWPQEVQALFTRRLSIDDFETALIGS
ncbi:hypothetical protein HY641_01000 [Candidatus Woesearchaeota archaeon]|nr:hypothetical protein [Candidatus Woesearchaeota archaeon]